MAETQTLEEAWAEARAEYEFALSALESGAELAHDECTCPTTAALVHHSSLCRTLREGLRVGPAGRERYEDAARDLALASFRLGLVTARVWKDEDAQRRRIGELGK